MTDREFGLLICLGMAIVGMIAMAWLWIDEVYRDD